MCCLIFQVIDTQRLHWAALLVSPAACTGPCWRTGREREAPVQLELQEAGFLRSGTAKWCSCWGNDPALKGLSLGILGYSVRKSHSCFWHRVPGACPGGNTQTPHLYAAWTSIKTPSGAAERPQSIATVQSVGSTDGVAKSGGPLMQLDTSSHKFEASFTYRCNNSHTKPSIHPGLASTLWGEKQIFSNCHCMLPWRKVCHSIR